MIKRLIIVLGLLLSWVGVKGFTVDNVQYLEVEGYENCVELSYAYATGEFSVPEKVSYNGVEYTVIGLKRMAFNGSFGAVKINLPSSLRYIGERAFNSCTSLESMTIPALVDSIECTAFEGCTALSAYFVDAENAHFSSVDGVMMNKAKTEIVFYPAGKKDETYVFPDTIEKIAKNAFANNAVLTKIVVSKVLREVGESGLSYCSKLEEIDLGEVNLTSLSRSAFYGVSKLKALDLSASSFASLPGNAFGRCSALATLKLPATLEKIDDYCFSSCSALEHLYVDAPNPPEFFGEMGAFGYGLSGIDEELCVLHVPTGSKAAYEADETWGAGFKTIVEGESIPEETMTFAYCGAGIEQTTGEKGASVGYKVAIEIPEATAKKIAGNKLVSILIGAGEESREQELFLTYDLDGEPFYTQKIDLKSNTWNTIELDKAYAIEGKTFFIGYQMVAGKSVYSTIKPLAFDGASANAYGDWVAVNTDGSSDWTWKHMGEEGLGNVCLKAVLKGASLPQFDVELQSVEMRRYAKPGMAFGIEGLVKNVAVRPVDSFDVIYQIGDGEPVTTNFKLEAPIANQDSYRFYVEGVEIDAEGDYDVTVTVSNLNGQEDEMPVDNTQSVPVTCTENIANKKILLEHFTTQSCTNCPAVDEILESLVGGNENVIQVAHHAGFGTDDYTIGASSKYLSFYGGSTYAPAIMLDRTNMAACGAKGSGKEPSPGPVFAVNNADDMVRPLRASMNEAAFVTVSINNKYIKETRVLEINVTGNTMDGFVSDGEVYLNVFLTESGLIGEQGGATGDYVHNHVIRQVISDVWGDAVEIAEGKYAKKYSLTLNEKWNPENMRVIAFLARKDEADINGWGVYNAEDTALNIVSSIENAAAEEVAVEGGKGFIRFVGDYEKAEIFQTNGLLLQTVEGQKEVVLSGGIYIVRLTTDDATTICKVAVKS